MLEMKSQSFLFILLSVTSSYRVWGIREKEEKTWGLLFGC